MPTEPVPEPTDTAQSGTAHSGSTAAARSDNTAAAPGAAAPAAGATTFSEKLWVPLWMWPVAIAIGVLLAAEVHMGAPGLRTWLPYVILIPFTVWAMFWLSRMRVEVSAGTGAETGARRSGELRVGRAHLPLDVIEKVAVIPGTAKSAALGRQLDPLAFVQHRTWVKQMVLIVLDDPDDPTPYWLVSTRRPEQLSAALTAGR